MIYQHVDDDTSIEQGDIFRDLPRIDMSLDAIAVLARDEESTNIEARELSWTEAIEDSTILKTMQTADQQQLRVLRAILPVCPVSAIVITQNCDAVRAEAISLCEIAPLRNVAKHLANITSPARLAKELTRQGTDHVRWFYLPPDASTNFNERMAVDFRSVLRIARANLETFRNHRLGRLNKVAYEHFREKLAEFFRRYPYDPWYPLNKEEFAVYAAENDGVQPFDYQK